MIRTVGGDDLSNQYKPQEDWSEGSPLAVMSAGDNNYGTTDMKTAFKEHDGAWPSAIALFACKSGLEEDSPQGQSD